jgi:hypothetical protein
MLDALTFQAFNIQYPGYALIVKKDLNRHHFFDFLAPLFGDAKYNRVLLLLKLFPPNS